MDIDNKQKTLIELEIINKLLDIKLKVAELRSKGLIAEKDKEAIENITANTSFILRETEIAKENVEETMMKLSEGCRQM